MAWARRVGGPPGDGGAPVRSNDTPGSRAIPKSRGLRGGTEPCKSWRSLARDRSLLGYFEAPKIGPAARTAGLRSREQVRRREAARAGPHRAGVPPTGSNRRFGVGRPYLVPGVRRGLGRVRVLGVAVFALPEAGARSGREARAGSRCRGPGGYTLGGSSPGEPRPSARGNSGRRERTRRGIKASKRVKLGAGGDPGTRCPGRTGSVACGSRRKGAHSRRGNQATARERGRRGNRRRQGTGGHVLGLGG